MSTELLFCLSRDFLKLFETSNACDVSIRVGEEPNARSFAAHSTILIARSQYFAAALSSEWAKKENGIVKSTKPNITPPVFEIILRYIYGGEVPLEQYEIPTILEILIAADELILEQLLEYTQTYLIENHAESLKQNFALIHQTAFQHESLKKLQDFCSNFAAMNPNAIFQSEDFVSLEENALISLLRRDNLSMNEIEIWDKVIRWGIAQTDSLPESVTDWSAKDFGKLSRSLEKLLPLIRFYHVSSVDFYHKIKPYAKILPGSLYENLLHHYLVPGSHDSDVQAKPPRSSVDYGDSLMLINSAQISKIIDWIKHDTITTTSPSSNKLKLLCRGSRDGFTPADFHGRCDDQGPTVTVIKVKGTGQIIGGYNPLSWNQRGMYEDGSDSFIFSLGTNLQPEQKLSRHNNGRGVVSTDSTGAIFGGGQDLRMSGPNFTRAQSYCRKSSFEHAIMSGADNKYVYFQIEEYEVFQIVTR